MTHIGDFGPLVVETDIDDAVISILRTWLPDYIGHLEGERGLAAGFIARPVASSFANALDSDEFLDHTLPAVIVTTAQTQGTPEKDGNGLYYASWEVVISCIVRGQKPSDTRRLAALFGGCIKRAMVQQLPDSCWWEQGLVAPVADSTTQGRYLAAGINHFRVDIDAVLSSQGGPTVPNAAPYDPGPPIKVVTAAVEIVPLTSPEHPVS